MEIDRLLDYGEELIKFDDLDDGIIGITINTYGESIIAYDYNKCINIIATLHNLDLNSAQEYLDFNIVNAYIGKQTPIFITLIN